MLYRAKPDNRGLNRESNTRRDRAVGSGAIDTSELGIALFLGAFLANEEARARADAVFVLSEEGGVG